MNDSERPSDADAPPWQREIEGLHVFFERWLRGTCPADDPTFRRVADVLAPGFQLINPRGKTTAREPLLDRLRKAHGSRPTLRIEIKAPSVRHTVGDVQVATYEEWQQSDDERDGRLSTVVFRTEASAPHGLIWLHVHETALEAPAP